MFTVEVQKLLLIPVSDFRRSEIGIKFKWFQCWKTCGAEVVVFRGINPLAFITLFPFESFAGISGFLNSAEPAQIVFLNPVIALKSNFMGL